MGKMMKRCLSFAMALVMVLSMAGGIPVFAGSERTPVAKITMSVERFTIGQGYVTAPKTVSVYAGETYADVLLRELGESNVIYSGTSKDNFYLQGIRNTVSGLLNIPQYVTDACGASNTSNTGNADNNLDMGDYHSWSGWMFSVNNAFPWSAMSAMTPTDGDVFRVQFSIYGGLDIGSSYPGAPFVRTMANKDAMTAMYARLLEDPDLEEIKNRVVDDETVVNLFGSADPISSWMLWMPDLLSGTIEDGLATQENLDALYTGILKALPKEQVQLTLSVPATEGAEGKQLWVKDSSGSALSLSGGIASADGSTIAYTATAAPGVYTYGTKDKEVSGTFSVARPLQPAQESQHLSFSRWNLSANSGWKPEKDFTVTVKGVDSGFSITPEVSGEEYTLLGADSRQWNVTVTPSGEKQQLGYPVYKAAMASSREWVVNVLQNAPNGNAMAILQENLSFLYAKVPAPTVSTVGGEWTMMALLRGGFSLPAEYKDGYLSRLKGVLDEKGAILSPRKYTDNARVVLALSAMGVDASRVYGYDLTQALRDMERVNAQGINGALYALLALDSTAALRESNEDVRQAYLLAILDSALPAGGFSMAGSVADPDITAMALQALAPYAGTSRVDTVIEKALAVLSAAQNADGGFSGSEGATAETTAQVVQALATLGINPDTDARFVKSGGSALAALCRFARSGGGFSHVLSDPTMDLMATDQGTLALVAYDRMLREENGLYRMDGKADGIAAPVENNPATGDALPIVAFLLSGVMLLCLGKKKKAM